MTLVKNTATSSSDRQYEAAIIQQAKAGRADAFTQLYDNYYDRINRFIFFRVGDDQLAEDLCADVFIKAWQHLESYQERGLPFSAWLFQIARNAIIDHYRQHKETDSLDELSAGVADPQVGIDEEMIDARLDAGKILKSMERLTVEQREVLILRFIEELSTREIAQVLGKGIGAIRALQMRGLQALNEILKDEA